MKSVLLKAIGGVAIALLIACAPVISQRGYLPDPSNEGAIKTGAKDTLSFTVYAWCLAARGKKEEAAAVKPGVRSQVLLLRHFLAP